MGPTRYDHDAAPESGSFELPDPHLKESPGFLLLFRIMDSGTSYTGQKAGREA